MTWPTKTDFVDGDVLTAAQVNNIGTNLNLADPTGITDGYVLTADGAGSMGWEVASGGWSLISSSTGSTVADVTFSSIPQTYGSLLLAFSVQPVSTAQLYLRMNGLTASYGYSGTYAQPVSTVAVYGGTSANAIRLTQGSSTGIYSGWVFFPSYTNGSDDRSKSACNFSLWGPGQAINGGGQNTAITAPLNSLTLLMSTGNIASYTCELWGI